MVFADSDNIRKYFKKGFKKIVLVWKIIMRKEMVKFVKSLYAAYEGCDASLFEINPVLKTCDDRILAVDSKVTLDNNKETCCKYTCCADGCCSNDCNTGDCSNSCCSDGCCSESDNCCS